MTIPDTGVYISPAQMYQEVRGLAEAVARIESKLDGILDDGKEARGLIADHEARIRTLEKSRWPLPTIGVLAGVAGAVTGALSLLGR
ncbi:hypothetical protein ACFQ7O_24175 [Streptomyces sp. NPDC056485]|uniref:hypothetical protein n=1 Tax=Streptomyces sp. NPDC056485 TaxID=3345834 RepID=UPI0036A598A3